jgi:ethanolaminephosphotransferase
MDFPSTRNFDSKELDARDWIAAEREYLIKMADAESEVEKRKTDGGVWRQYVGLLVSSLSHPISHTPSLIHL